METREAEYLHQHTEKVSSFRSCDRAANHGPCGAACSAANCASPAGRRTSPQGKERFPNGKSRQPFPPSSHVCLDLCLTHRRDIAAPQSNMQLAEASLYKCSKRRDLTLPSACPAKPLPRNPAVSLITCCCWSPVLFQYLARAACLQHSLHIDHRGPLHLHATMLLLAHSRSTNQGPDIN